MATQLLACGERVVGWPAGDTGPGVDTGETVAPTVIQTRPLSFATGVSGTALVEATFSEPMQAATLTGSSFEVTGPGGNPVAGLVTYSASDATGVFTPDATLEVDTTYTATVTTDATDLAGNGLADDYVWTFTTADPVIPTIPTVLFTAPVDLEADVSVDARPLAVFSETMDPLTLTTSTFTVEDADGLVDGTVTPVDDIVEFTPTTDLDPGTEYTATITADAATPGGTPLAEDYVWTFTTEDAPIPRVVLTAPEDGEIDVSTGASIQAVFSETMDPLTLTSSTFTVEDADGLVDGTVDPIDDLVEFTPDADLEPGTEYTATITADAATPIGTPIVEDYVWTFTTAFEPPIVISTDPLDQDFDVLLDTTVDATFNVDMEPNTITDTSFVLTDLDNNEITAQVDYDELSRTATLTPDAHLTPLTSYRATVTTDASDLQGIDLVSDYTWTFTTMESPLGMSYPFGIAATAGITNAGATTINGDVVLDPNTTCNAVTVGSAGTIGSCNGFAPTVNGDVISPLFPDAGFTSGMVKADLRQAYIDFSPANLPPDTAIAAGTTLGAPAGNTLVEGDNLFFPGVYQSDTTIMITGDLTLDAQGDPNATFVFQSSGTIGTAATGQGDPHTRILLINGAQAANVYWHAGGAATLGTYTEFQGNILAYSDITMETGTTSCGRLFAGASTDGAFVLDTNVVSVPGSCP